MNENMDRKEALSLFGLDETAEQREIDRKYFVLMKNYRGEGNKEKLAELAFAYDVITGKIEELRLKAVEREKAKKYFGKTASEWRIYLGYTWWQYALAAVAAGLLVSLVLNAVFQKEVDLQVVSLGHFSADTTVLTDYAVDEMGFDNPTVTAVDLIADPAVEQSEITMVGPQIAMAQLSTKPDVVLTDRMTMMSYLEVMKPLDDFYLELEKELSPEMFGQIIPIRAKLAEYREMTTMEGYEVKYEPGDHEEYIYGLMIEDPVLIYGYGYYSLWLPYEEPEKELDPTLRDPSLIFALTTHADDPERGQKFVQKILSDQDFFQELSTQKLEDAR